MPLNSWFQEMQYSASRDCMLEIWWLKLNFLDYYLKLSIFFHPSWIKHLEGVKYLVWAIPCRSKDLGRWIIPFFFFSIKNFLFHRFLLNSGQVYAFLFSGVISKFPYPIVIGLKMSPVSWEISTQALHLGLALKMIKEWSFLTCQMNHEPRKLTRITWADFSFCSQIRKALGRALFTLRKPGA